MVLALSLVLIVPVAHPHCSVLILVLDEHSLLRRHSLRVLPQRSPRQLVFAAQLQPLLRGAAVEPLVVEWLQRQHSVGPLTQIDALARQSVFDAYLAEHLLDPFDNDRPRRVSSPRVDWFLYFRFYHRYSLSKC